MSGELPPLIRLEVHEMKFQIMHYLHQHHERLEAETERQIEQAIQSFSFGRVVTDEVHSAIDQAIRRYFRDGDGFVAVYNAVVDALNSTFKKDGEKE